MASSHGSRYLWIVAAALVALYGVLAVVVRIAPDNGIDRSVADWVSRWDVPVLDTTMGCVLVPIVALLTLPIVLVGPARVLVGVHWSTDVRGAYLLGAATMIAVLLLFGIGDRWLSSRGLLEDSPSRARPQSAAAVN